MFVNPPFVAQWLLSPGYPKLKGKFDYSAEKKQVRVSFEQTQKDEKQGVGFFEFAFDVRQIRPKLFFSYPPLLGHNVVTLVTRIMRRWRWSMNREQFTREWSRWTM